MSEILKTRRPEGSSLELSEAALGELASQVSQLVTDYFSDVSSLPVFPETSAGNTLAHIGTSLPSESVPLEELLNDCRAIIENSRHNGHPCFFGYVASPSTPPGAFADLIASALNSNVTSWRSGPAATEIERTVVRWLGSLIGYDDNTAGLLTSGGSMANMTAMLIAHRTKSDPGVAAKGLWDSGRPMTIYASDQIHMSIPKAADILGLGRAQVRLVKSDDSLRMNVAHLRECISRDLANGLKPFCVIASAGTVNTGAVDPLDEIAAVAKEFALWFHIDGAYGALATLDETKRPLFKGLERADSISLDPHKWLYVPIDSGCLLFRDEARARAAFSFDEADYIKVHEQNADEAFAFWNYGPELSRRFRALKIWLTLRYYGARRIAQAISEDNALAAYLGERVEQAEDFEILACPQLSICCFRYLPPSLQSNGAASIEATDESSETELNELNSKIMHAVQRGGRAYLSSATIRGKFALRACITNFRTTRADIDETLEIIRDAAQQVGTQGGT
ncbi:MAG TPA: pyridoxal-dependent decarboxylase [Blastocatellia bacterium]|jgi:glutamate/tyrosine decarboxylase-like PLP-dependent enzyme|nr:pyridoxal-dependent decarboxylase [Blastocatellia bacterium]HAF25348.1 pyridoxal-dependent decarboxylase [Blastocatellia bacterium]HCX30062.1 pyridoxal-dependent decarboxylase [Blastocatellia bacterium]